MRFPAAILFTFVLLFAALSAFSQSFQNVLIHGTGNPNEVSICINPRNTNQMVAGSNINNYYYSSDAGLNWTRSTLTSTYGVYGDPIIIADTNGHFHYFHLSNPASGSWLDRIVAQKSTNGGANWTSGTFMGLNGTKDQDKEGCVVDPNNNNIYVTWTQFDVYGSTNPQDSSHIMFSKSTNGGLNWSAALRLDKKGGDCIDEDNTTEGAVPCVGPNGEIYVCWSAYGQLYFDKSTDGGVTWKANDTIITLQPGGWDYSVPGIYRANGLPATVSDLSNSPYRGTIYVNWTDQRNGSTDTDVWLIKSTDGGNTWSNVKRVNNDPAGRHQFFTWMTVDQVTGYLYFVFYDRRNYNDNRTDVYLARSTDGGETFDNMKLNATPFNPDEFTFFGDYTGISAHNGIVRPIWMRLENNQLSVWTAIVDFITNVQQISSVVPSSSGLYDNFPNPFNPSTKIKFDVSSAYRPSEYVKLAIYDAAGREMALLVNQEMKSGTYEKEWDASNLSSGVYFAKIQIGSYSETIRMALIK